MGRENGPPTTLSWAGWPYRTALRRRSWSPVHHRPSRTAAAPGENREAAAKADPALEETAGGNREKRNTDHRTVPAENADFAKEQQKKLRGMVEDAFRKANRRTIKAPIRPIKPINRNLLHGRDTIFHKGVTKELVTRVKAVKPSWLAGGEDEEYLSHVIARGDFDAYLQRLENANAGGEEADEPDLNLSKKKTRSPKNDEAGQRPGGDQPEPRRRKIRNGTRHMKISITLALTADTGLMASRLLLPRREDRPDLGFQRHYGYGRRPRPRGQRLSRPGHQQSLRKDSRGCGGRNRSRGRRGTLRLQDAKRRNSGVLCRGATAGTGAGPGRVVDLKMRS